MQHQTDLEFLQHLLGWALDESDCRHPDVDLLFRCLVVSDQLAHGGDCSGRAEDRQSIAVELPVDGTAKVSSEFTP